MINDFHKPDYRFLSNFYECPVEYEGVVYPSLEHAYVAAKVTDLAHRDYIRKFNRPGDAKTYGRHIRVRPEWNDEFRLGLMEQLLLKKFLTEPLRTLLLETKGHMLVEGNYWHDNFFGDCSCTKCDSVVGENNLGKLLMKIRGSN